MTRFDRVLSDDELWAAAAEVEWQGTIGEYRLIEQAVLAKLAEQDPVGSLQVNSATGIEIIYHQFHGLYNGMKLYAHPMPCVSHTSDKTACVLESGESETQESAPFTPKTVPEMRSFIGMHFDSLQYANPETEEPDEMDRYTLTIHDLLSAFDWAGHYDCDHIPDIGQMVPDGWQLVPRFPTDAMLEQIKLMDGFSSYALMMRYTSMLAAAPKYTGEK